MRVRIRTMHSQKELPKDRSTFSLRFAIPNNFVRFGKNRIAANCDLGNNIVGAGVDNSNLPIYYFIGDCCNYNFSYNHDNKKNQSDFLF